MLLNYRVIIGEKLPGKTYSFHNFQPLHKIIQRTFINPKVNYYFLTLGLNLPILNTEHGSSMWITLNLLNFSP